MGLIVQLVSSAWGRMPILSSSTLLQQEIALIYADASFALSLLQSSRLMFYAISILVAFALYKLVFAKLIYTRRMHEVGYITSHRQSAVDRANEVRRRRQRGDLPPVYPNGWYRLCGASEMKKGDVKQCHILGMDLAVFRTESGKAACVSAYCTHLGANIAAGGTVTGEHIECPFHGWQFDGEGKCKSIPYSNARIPEQAHLDNYEILEINDMILFWFDAEGRDPTWYPPEVPEIGKQWSLRGITTHFVNSHIQEVPENAADVAHLNYLHAPGLLSGTDLRETHDKKYEFLQHEWLASWAAETDDGRRHLSVLTLTHRLKMFGWALPMLDLRVTATQVGPGLVYLHFDCFFGKGIFVQSLTPQEPLYQELTHTIYTSWTIPQFMAKFYLFGEAKQVERDVMIWNNKMYRKNPVLIKEDTLIAKHRRWYSQFYSENSPTYESVMNGGLDW